MAWCGGLSSSMGTWPCTPASGGTPWRAPAGAGAWRTGPGPLLPRAEVERLAGLPCHAPAARPALTPEPVARRTWSSARVRRESLISDGSRSCLEHQRHPAFEVSVMLPWRTLAVLHHDTERPDPPQPRFLIHQGFLDSYAGIQGIQAKCMLGDSV